MIKRREALARGAVCLGGALLGPRVLASEGSDARRVARIGLLTDVHYADKGPRRSRYYRDSLDKIRMAIDAFNDAEVDAIIELGDLIDSGDGSVDAEIMHLQRVDAELARCRAECHYVFGNHCVHTLRKDEFIEASGARSPHESFELGGVRCIILDACFRPDGVAYERDNFDWRKSFVPADQITWLKNELEDCSTPVLVFIHQRLDGDEWYTVSNAPEIRSVLEQSDRVAAVFQGHSHQNELNTVNGIDYCVLRAMVEGRGVENNGYAWLDLFEDGSALLEGAHFQETRRFESWAQDSK